LRNREGKVKILIDSQPISAEGYIAGSAGQQTKEWIAEFAQGEDYFEGYCVDVQSTRVIKEKIRLSRREWQIAVSAQDPVISVHIPAGKGFTEKNIESAYARCYDILSRCFPEYRPKCFYCHSWLLDPQLREYLKPTSNIVAFQSKYLRFATLSLGKDVFTFLFHMPSAKSFLDLPENSSLQKCVKKLYLGGGYIYEPCGIFFVDSMYNDENRRMKNVVAEFA